MTSHALRDYQASGIASVERKWADGIRSICFVIPTGGGKTRSASELALRAIGRGQRVLWLAHRTELIKQAEQRLRGEGIRYTGIVAPWAAPSPHAPCQVASLQTLAARSDHRPAADIIIPDECHHLLSDEWRAVYDSPEYRGALTVGLTATPERGDGKPLGDIFQDIVVAATYSQLISAGHILPCKVFRPDARLRKDLALDPVVAYSRYAPGQKAFCFTSTVATAQSTAAAFNAAGIKAAAIDAKTSPGKRAELLKQFELGDLMVLCNAYLFTEGVDIPIASCCILARRVLHVTPFLQMCGRVLRPWGDQRFATLIDLPGASLNPNIGLPTEDREYSLTGRGIRRLTTEPVRTCPKCGMCVEPGVMECPNIEITTREVCGFRWVPGVRTPPKYLSLELREVYAGSETPEDAKRREWNRLLSKGSVAKAVHIFQETFGHSPPEEYLSAVPETVRREEYQRLRGLARTRGFSAGWAAHQFKAALGAFPPWSWTREPIPNAS